MLSWASASLWAWRGRRLRSARGYRPVSSLPAAPSYPVPGRRCPGRQAEAPIIEGGVPGFLEWFSARLYSGIGAAAVSCAIAADCPLICGTGDRKDVRWIYSLRTTGEAADEARASHYRRRSGRRGEAAVSGNRRGRSTGNLRG